ncbi:RNA polymerase-associated protein RapA [Moorella thermoacetica]|uniref:RNA polymerase-associated protein RapA n=1 Tax=Neomoorella thermoacetica TaxID=1525 RepID=A0ABY3N253_NEOTH|nr:RNA polymerase-associated protein RapA [Moorella thermoacetica]
MAGLLLKELKYRGLVSRTLIIVPGHLKDQWLREMKERFQERFIIVIFKDEHHIVLLGKI